MFVTFLAFFSNRMVVTQVVGLLFGLFAVFHIVLPPSVDAPAMVALIMLVLAVVTAIIRFGQPGAPVADAIAWWQSRTIWAQLVAIVAMIAVMFGAPVVDQVSIVGTIMTVVALINLVLHASTTQPIART